MKKVASGDNGDRKSGQVWRQNADLTLPGLQREKFSARRLLKLHISIGRDKARKLRHAGSSRATPCRLRANLLALADAHAALTL
ncbi:hypothetical protein [Novosphingobium sp.]|uniref:hypothetical protein n=1 Tax=Novosphingobium sp. TaxID=1874826 RepID=UPI002734AF77|nr:hypothetical protein [Novosphingobium sp.]MDP3907573.1 hypothetical protein [Novosphingobium sp.]